MTVFFCFFLQKWAKIITLLIRIPQPHWGAQELARIHSADLPECVLPLAAVFQCRHRHHLQRYASRFRLVEVLKTHSKEKIQRIILGTLQGAFHVPHFIFLCKATWVNFFHLLYFRSLLWELTLVCQNLLGKGQANQQMIEAGCTAHPGLLFLPGNGGTIFGSIDHAI